jgi:hypothetical protein
MDKSGDATPTTTVPGKGNSPRDAPASGHSSPTSASSSPSRGIPGHTGTKAYAVYYLGSGPTGEPVLFRELHHGSTSTTPGALAVEGLGTTPLDPDYSTAWHPGDLLDAKANPKAGVIFVTLGHRGLLHRPATMSAAEAKAAIQQVVYTVQAALHSRLPVDFYFHAKPAAHVLGIPTPQPVARGKVLSTLSLVSISSPNEDDKVSGRLTVTGVNNGFEGSVAVYLERAGKKYLMKPTIGGWGGNRLYPWQVTLNLAKVEPGTYTLVAKNDDPSGRAHPATDTRTIEVK